MPDHATATPFPPTRWSVVLSARNSPGSAPSQEAMELLCRLYWRPLYAFARGSGLSPADAEDRTQEFLTRVVVGGNLFAEAEPNLGKLRTFMLTAFRRDIIDGHRAANRQKRGAGKVVSLDLLGAEGHVAQTLSTLAEPSSMFEREWAQSVIRDALNRLAVIYEEGGKGGLFNSLKPFISIGGGEGSYDQLGAATGLGLAAARQAVHRLRSRFREMIRNCIADTLNDATETEIDAELLALRNVLRDYSPRG